ncbi:sulfuric ester hydrolase [Aureococcus anophagefferens]|nr:sulfuric ester hydrolase [Aureococcus anophagefferens]
MRRQRVFDRAYCQLSVCAPSRNSFFTGRRPDSLRVYNFVDHFRSTSPEAVPLPEYFKNHGYVTLGAGKTYQPGKPPAYDVGRSWSAELPYLPLMKNLTRCSRKNAKSGRFLDVCPEDFGEEAFMDRLTADYAVEAMRVARKVERPFFVVAGFYRPHLRWHVPRAFYDRYSGTLGTPLRSRSKPSNMPDIAWANEGCHTMTTEEHGTVAVSMDRPLKRSMVAELRKGYLACASWIDELAGRVLDAADAVPSAKADTVVLLSSDHGFHLGEQASWTKHTLFEIGSRVPLVVRAPGVAPGRSRALVELTDVYRTFADLAGLPAPARDVQGKSLGPLLRSGAPHRNFSVTQYPRCPRDYRKQWDANCKRLTAAEIPVMGYTLRVDHFRFTEWYYWVAAPATRANERFDPPEKVVDKKRKPLATELYALDDARINDFDGLELANVAGDPRAACAVAALRPRSRSSSSARELAPEEEPTDDGGGDAADADPAARASAEAARLKAKGNACFNNGCYVDAWENYSDAIDCLAAAGVAGRAEDAKLHTNRAACLLTADRWVPAAHDGARAIALDAEWWKGYWYRGQALLGQLKGKRPSKVMQQKAEVALKALERASQCRGFPEDKRERVEQLQARARNIVFYLAQNQCPTQ